MIPLSHNAPGVNVHGSGVDRGRSQADETDAALQGPVLFFLPLPQYFGPASVSRPAVSGFAPDGLDEFPSPEYQSDNATPSPVSP